MLITPKYNNTFAYKQNANCKINKSNTLNQNAPSFGNQTKRGVTSKLVGAIEDCLGESNLSNKFMQKMKSDHKKYKSIQESRWNVRNKKYQGKDRDWEG